MQQQCQRNVAMELRPIKTESDYCAALKEIEKLFDAEPNSPECDCLEILTTLVEAYELSSRLGRTTQTGNADFLGNKNLVNTSVQTREQ
jgi:hypothetical protein